MTIQTIYDKELGCKDKELTSQEHQHHKDLINIQRRHEQMNVEAQKEVRGEDSDLVDALAQYQALKDSEQSLLAEYHQQKLDHAAEKLEHAAELDDLKIKHKQEMRGLRIEHATVIIIRQDKTTAMQTEQVEYIDTYSGVLEEYSALVDEDKHIEKTLGRVSNTSKQQLQSMRKLRDLSRSTAAKLVSEKLNML